MLRGLLLHIKTTVKLEVYGESKDAMLTCKDGNPKMLFASRQTRACALQMMWTGGQILKERKARKTGATKSGFRHAVLA